MKTRKFSHSYKVDNGLNAWDDFKEVQVWRNENRTSKYFLISKRGKEKMSLSLPEFLQVCESIFFQVATISEDEQ